MPEKVVHQFEHTQSLILKECNSSMKTRKEIQANLDRLRNSTLSTTQSNQNYIDILEWVLEVEN